MSASAKSQQVRLGLSAIRGIGDEVAERIEAARLTGGPFTDMADTARRGGLTTAQLEALATAGAFGCFERGGRSRREALWAAGAVAQAASPHKLDGIVVGEKAPPLDSMSTIEEMASDLWSTGISLAGHPMQLVREELTAQADPFLGGPAHRRAQHHRAGGRRGDPPPTALDSGRHDLHQPGRRDGNDQHHLFGGRRGPGTARSRVQLPP